MNLPIKAGSAFHWFGHDYAAGDTVDVTGWTAKAIRQLMVKAPVYVDDNLPNTSLPASAAQSMTKTNPSDASAIVQAQIDAAWSAGGGLVVLPAGVWYGSFKMRPNVDVAGSGWQTVLRALPGQTAPVVDYATYNAYHCSLRDLRVDGNYLGGRTDGVAQGTGRCISMDTTPATQGNYPFNNAGWNNITPMSDGSVQPNGRWNDSANTIDRVLVTGAGGDWAVYLGPNQRGAWLHDVFVLSCKNGAINNAATDTQCTNVQAGNCGDGILIANANQQWTNCKSWYHGVNAGYTGTGDGWRITLPRDNLIGPTRLIGCESQDNIRYGLNLHVAESVVADRFTTGGDSGAGVRLGDAQGNSLNVHFANADRAQDTVGFLLDGAAGAPTANEITWTADLVQFASAFTPVSAVSGGSAYGNSWNGPARMRGMESKPPAAAVTPRSLTTLISGAWAANMTINAPVPDIVGSIQPGERVLVSLFDSVGGHTVTWGAGYLGAAGFTTVAGKRSIFQFVCHGFNIWLCVGSVVNA